MKKRIYLCCIGVLLLLLVGCMEEDKEVTIHEADAVKEQPMLEAGEKKIDVIEFTYEPLPEDIETKMTGGSWKSGSPVALEDLAYVKVFYWGFDDKIHEGALVVHQQVAEEVAEIFKILYEAKFPIEKVRLIDEYGGDDDLSMEDNNTSAFNFREVAGSQTLSKHSYGIAIDINPIQNPYIKGEKVSPEAGKDYMERTPIRKGMIIKGDICYEAFKERGWDWGGEWKTLKDYQHFQKVISFDE